MKITQNVQYGILLALYLSRSGRSNLKFISEGMKLSKPFLEQVARKLRLSGVIRSVRGPGGGYELVGEPTVRDIFNSLAPVKLVNDSDVTKYRVGSIDERALVHFTGNVSASFSPLMSRKIKSLWLELVANDDAHMNRIAADSAIN